MVWDQVLEPVILVHQKILGNRGNQAADNRTTSTASCDLPEQLPSLVVGLDGPLEELKKTLLKTDKSLLLVTAMGGCGKTLLAQKFCHDPQVKGTPFVQFLDFQLKRAELHSLSPKGKCVVF